MIFPSVQLFIDLPVINALIFLVLDFIVLISKGKTFLQFFPGFYNE